MPSSEWMTCPDSTSQSLAVWSQDAVTSCRPSANQSHAMTGATGRGGKFNSLFPLLSLLPLCSGSIRIGCFTMATGGASETGSSSDKFLSSPDESCLVVDLVRKETGGAGKSNPYSPRPSPLLHLSVGLLLFR